MAETLNKAIKAVRAYAKKHNKPYYQVELIYISKYGEYHKGKFLFKAYIMDFNIFAESETVAGLIEKFEEIRPNVTITPAATDYDDLPF